MTSSPAFVMASCVLPASTSAPHVRQCRSKPLMGPAKCIRTPLACSVLASHHLRLVMPLSVGLVVSLCLASPGLTLYWRAEWDDQADLGLPSEENKLEEVDLQLWTALWERGGTFCSCFSSVLARDTHVPLATAHRFVDVRVCCALTAAQCLPPLEARDAIVRAGLAVSFCLWLLAVPLG